MKKRGFTLVELLAVIVVLIIIILIAIPLIIDVIEQTEKSGAEASANLGLKKIKKNIFIKKRLK